MSHLSAFYEIFGKNLYLIRFAPLAFVPHSQNRSGQMPPPLVVLLGLTHFTGTQGILLASPRSRALQCSLHADKLSLPISQRIYKACYERFRPNNRDSRLGRWGYRGGWHQSCPPLIRQAIYTWQKPNNVEHLGFPSHTFVHWKVFAPAAPRGAGTSISVSLSGLPLSWPVRIFGLVVHYTANSLIRRRPILRHKFKEEPFPGLVPYQVLPSLSRSYPRP